MLTNNTYVPKTIYLDFYKDDFVIMSTLQATQGYYQ